MKTVNISDKVLEDAESVAAMLGMSRDKLISQALEATVSDLKGQVAALMARKQRLARNPEAANKALAALAEGIPEELADLVPDPQKIEELRKKQEAIHAQNQKIACTILGYQLNHH